ncbi:MAG: SpoIID/LytB domain-containing protein, partial [Planctomycetota bacterium]
RLLPVGDATFGVGDRQRALPGSGRSAPAVVSAAPSAVDEVLWSGPLVRVLIRRTDGSVTLRTAKGVRLWAVSGRLGRSLRAGRELGRMPAGRKVSAAIFGDTGVRCGDWATSLRAIVIRPETPGAAAVWVGDRRYRGEVRVLRSGQRELAVVNAVPLEAYVATVVDSEMPATFPSAARRAQAVAARTYVLSRMVEANGHPDFDVYDDARSQRYLGFQYRAGERVLAGETSAGRAAARQTEGVVCVRNGQLLRTYYSAVCGGRTTRGAAVFRDAAALVSVPCTWCRAAALYRWHRRVALTEASRDLAEWARARGADGELQDVTLVDPDHVSDRQAVPTVRVRFSHGQIDVSAADFRRLMPTLLPSPFFLVHREGTALVFDGRGSGHGVGLCQWGAAGLAKAGRTTRQILQYYYPRAALIRLTW